jgi:hypothetical protein
LNRDIKKIYNNYRYIIEQKSTSEKIVPDEINLDEEDFENFDWGSLKGQLIPHIRLPEEKLSSVHDKVLRAMVLLKTRFPTIVDMLNQLRKVATYDRVATAAVDKNFNLYYNPTFFYCLPIHYVASILAHEAFHYLNNTFKRAEWATSRFKIDVNHDLWNVATDLTMNYELVRKGLEFPKGFCVPNEKGIFKFPEHMGGKEINVLDYTSEQIYNFLNKNISKTKPEDDPQPPYIPKVGDIIGDKETNTKRKIVKVDKKSKKVTTVPV